MKIKDFIKFLSIYNPELEVQVCEEPFPNKSMFGKDVTKLITNEPLSGQETKIIILHK